MLWLRYMSSFMGSCQYSACTRLQKEKGITVTELRVNMPLCIGHQETSTGHRPRVLKSQALPSNSEDKISTYQTAPYLDT